MTPPVCRFLRTKKLYIPEQADSAFAAPNEAGASAHCWCNRTMCEVGLDDRVVGLADCSRPERSCYQEP